MAVDDRRHKEFAGHIDLGRAGWDGDLSPDDLGNAAVTNNDGDVGLLFAAGAVDEGEVVKEDGWLLGLYEGGEREEERDQGVSHTREFEWKVRVFPGTTQEAAARYYELALRGGKVCIL